MQKILSTFLILTLSSALLADIKFNPASKRFFTTSTITPMKFDGRPAAPCPYPGHDYHQLAEKCVEIICRVVPSSYINYKSSYEGEKVLQAIFSANGAHKTNALNLCYDHLNKVGTVAAKLLIEDLKKGRIDYQID